MCPWDGTPTFLCKFVAAHLQFSNTSESLVIVSEGVIFWLADFEHLFQGVRSHLTLELTNLSLTSSFTAVLLCGVRRVSYPSSELQFLPFYNVRKFC